MVGVFLRACNPRHRVCCFMGRRDFLLFLGTTKPGRQGHTDAAAAVGRFDDAAVHKVGPTAAAEGASADGRSGPAPSCRSRRPGMKRRMMRITTRRLTAIVHRGTRLGAVSPRPEGMRRSNTAVVVFVLLLLMMMMVPFICFFVPSSR